MSLTASELEGELNTLLALVHRLSPPLNSRPSLFLEQKDALGSFVADLIKRAGGKVTARGASFCADQADTGHSHVRGRGRTIPIERRPIGPRVPTRGALQAARDAL